MIKKSYHDIINKVMITPKENNMIRTQIQLTSEQAQGLKRLAINKKKSISELIRLSVDVMIRSNGFEDQNDLRLRAITAAGQLKGPEDLANGHDDYLADAYK